MPSLSKGAQIAIGATLVAALLGWYGYTNLAGEATFTYYKTLDEFRASGMHVPSRNLRVHGYVASGSIKRDLAAREVRFAVQNDPPHASPDSTAQTAPDSAPQAEGASPGEFLWVVYQSLETPDLFKSGAEVVVEGRMEARARETLFVASNVMAKCPSKFQAKAEQEQAL